MAYSKSHAAIADKSIPLDTYRALGENIPDGPYFQKLARLASELQVYLIAGMMEADDEDRFNTAAMIGPDGKLIGRYHKQRLGHEAVRQVCEAVNTISDVAQGECDGKLADYCQYVLYPSGNSSRVESSDSGELAAALDNFDNCVILNPVSYNDKILR